VYAAAYVEGLRTLERLCAAMAGKRFGPNGIRRYLKYAP